MSNPNTAEEFVQMNRQYRDFANMVLDDEERDELYEMMQGHTAQTLDRLKEKVQGLEKESELLQGIWQDEFNKGFNDGCKKILQLIEEVSDE